MTEREVVHEILDKIMTEVANYFPDHGEMRLNVYAEISEKLRGVVSSLRERNEPVLGKVQNGENLHG